MTQTEALAILKTGANVFLTGEPGSGKTYTVNRYVEYLRERGVEPAITASTGIAATHIGGITIHSWSAIGIKTELDEYDLDRIAQNEKAARRIRLAQALIIDEVSMLSARTFAMVDAVCRGVRRSSRAFGGLQVVLVGDFFQLPPVVRQETEEREGPKARLAFFGGGNARSQFAYESPVWSALNPLVCYLSEQHRQEDAIFLEILSALRKNILTDKHTAHLKARRQSGAEGVTKLFPHNVDVDRINENELAKLPGAPRLFHMESRGPAKLVAQLKRSCLSPEELYLKLGAKVMFTKNNFDEGFANGTTGEVVGFRKSDGCPLVKARAGHTIAAEPMEWVIEAQRRILARIIQIPLRLAWAITVHKSQGMSLDAAFIDLSESFEYGQGYVALSRVRALAGLYLLGWNDRALEVHPDILKKDIEFKEQSERAGAAFRNIGAKDLAGMHDNFIRACGGKKRKNVPELVLSKE